jgi:hypothetical protein
LAILNPEHLLEQADRLIEPPPAGPPRQVDIRRAISAAYYAVFHFTLAEAANQFVGKTKQSTRQYGLVYRSVDHGALYQLCTDAAKPTLPPKLALHVPQGKFGRDIQQFAGLILELQRKRHSADYDPSIRVKTSDALLAARAARNALARFNAASAVERESFLSLLLFKPR